MDRIRLGIVGCGVIGGHHVKAAVECPQVELVAVADRIEDRVKATAENFKVPAWYTDDEALLDDKGVQAVVLALPTGVRTPVALKAIERGKHVLLEKPVASRAEEVEMMISLRRGQTVACCSSRMSFTGHAEAAAKCVASGALGTIRVVRFRIVGETPAKPSDSPPPWRQSMKLNGGGILVNWSCYDLDYMMQILNWQVRPRAVSAQWWPVAGKMSAYVASGSDADSHFIAFIRCDDGIVLSMERGEFTSSTTDQAWEIVGTDGTLHLPMRPQKGKPNAVILDRFVPGTGIVSETLWDESQGNPKEGVLEDFVQAILERRPPRTTLEQALVMQRITDALYASSKSGTAVAIS